VNNEREKSTKLLGVYVTINDKLNIAKHIQQTVARCDKHCTHTVSVKTAESTR